MDQDNMLVERTPQEDAHTSTEYAGLLRMSNITDANPQRALDAMLDHAVLGHIITTQMSELLTPL